jgi:hypothetical protein
MWRSGELKAGGIVPWETQASNLLPDNFLWEKDRSSILAITPGYYLVELAIFSTKRVSATLHLNGDSLAQLTERDSKERRRRDPRLAATLRECLLLPPKARISVLYHGEAPGEGFLAIKRL